MPYGGVFKLTPVCGEKQTLGGKPSVKLEQQAFRAHACVLCCDSLILTHIIFRQRNTNRSTKRGNKRMKSNAKKKKKNGRTNNKTRAPNWAKNHNAKHGLQTWCYCTLSVQIQQTMTRDGFPWLLTLGEGWSSVIVELSGKLGKWTKAMQIRTNRCYLFEASSLNFWSVFLEYRKEVGYHQCIWYRLKEREWESFRVKS